MGRKPVSLKIDHELWQKVLRHCDRESIDLSEYIEEVLTRDLIQNIIPENENGR